jgi:DNA-binding XRE family transcriptional regulator
MQWAQVLGMRLVLEPVGFPPARAGTAVDELLAAVATEMTPGTSVAWRSVAVLDDLIRIRRTCRVTQAQLAAQIGISAKTVSMVETGGSATALVVLQRHARGIARCVRLPDAYLSVRLEDDTQVV